MSDNTPIKSENWMRNLLFGSVGLNVFLAGFLFANLLGPTPSGSETTPIHVSMGSLPNDMPMELREELEDSFRNHSAEVEEAYRELATVRVWVQDILEQPELDRAALEEALEDIRDIQVKIQIPMHEVLIEAAMNLDAETRRALLSMGDRFDVRGVWDSKKFDGARWKIEFENGEIRLDLQGITDRRDDDRDDD